MGCVLCLCVTLFGHRELGTRTEYMCVGCEVLCCVSVSVSVCVVCMHVCVHVRVCVCVCVCMYVYV